VPKFVQYGGDIDGGETLTLKAHPSQTLKRFWIDGEGRDEIYGRQPCRFDCASPAVIEVRSAEGTLFPGKGGHEGFAEVGEGVGWEW
jgi:hypothetical protein